MRAYLALLMLFMVLNVPAHAQSSGQDAWTGQRGDFLHQTKDQSDRFQDMGNDYMSRNQFTVRGWWDGWESRQPYPGSRDGNNSGAAIRTHHALDQGSAPLPSGGTSRNQSNRPVEPLPVEDMVRDDFQGLYPYGQ